MINSVCVIGLGYIGLPTAAILASRKIKVLGVDIRQSVVDTINRGEIHLVEPDLDILVHATVSDGYLRATITPEESDVFIISVPTPLTHDKEPDTSYIEQAAFTLSSILKKGDLVVLESTSPVGTTQLLAELFAQKRPDLKFPIQCSSPDVNIAYCPERVLPGRVLHELVHNDRVIGGLSDECAKKAVALYKRFVIGDCITTSARLAEMCKLTENSFRDVNIAFANELSMICDKLDIDVWELIRLANRHPRVNILQPGPGVGGHCIAVDPWFIVSSAREEANLIAMARSVNDSKINWVINKFNKIVADYLLSYPQKMAKDVTVACLGITFKSDIDDLRESPALEIVKHITKEHLGPLYVVEPNIRELPESLANGAQLCDLDMALNEADIILILVDHAQFKSVPSCVWSKYIMLDVRGITDMVNI